jgi:hypothetical protein
VYLPFFGIVVICKLVMIFFIWKKKSCSQLEDRVARCESYYRDIQSDYEEACKALELAESIRTQMTSAFEDIKTVFIDGMIF